MINYKSLTKRIAPLVLAGGLTALVTGCNNSNEPQAVESPSYTNEVLSLGTHFNYSHALYAGQKGEVEYIDSLPMQRDLPDYSKPVIIFKDSRGIIHLPSNSVFNVSKNKNFHFELELNKDSQTETQ